MKILIIGQGKIGQEVSNQLAQQQLAVTGVARRSREQYQLADNVAYIQQDATELTLEQLLVYTHICVIVAPNMQALQRSSAADKVANSYRDTYLAIAEHLAKVNHSLTRLQRLVFISSTGVYGQDSGEWIDEDTLPSTPKRPASQIILHAEQTLQQAFADKLVIIRPSGIYGVERLMRVRIAREMATGKRKPQMPQYAWTNRIMDTDLVNIIVNVLTINAPKAIYLATDYLPVTSYALTCELCAEFDLPEPKIDETAPVSGKRLQSNIPLAWLEFADWQSGYQHILARACP